mgnify:CR=1 FL=1
MYQLAIWGHSGHSWDSLLAISIAQLGSDAMVLWYRARVGEWRWHTREILARAERTDGLGWAARAGGLC